MLLKRFKKIRKKSLVKNVNNIKTTDTSDLVKKTDYNTKFNEIEQKGQSNKYFTTQEFIY